VNQTRPHCVNQMGKTHSKPLAARRGRGTACYVWIDLYSTSLWYMPTNVRCIRPSSHSTHRGDSPIPAILWSASQVWWSPRPR